MEDDSYSLRNGKKLKKDKKYSDASVLETDFTDFKKFTCDRLAELGGKIEVLSRKNDDYLIQENSNLRAQLQDKEDVIENLKQRELFLQEELASKNKIVSLLTEDLVNKSSHDPKSSRALACDPPPVANSVEAGAAGCHGDDTPHGLNDQGWTTVNSSKKPSATRAERNEWLDDWGADSIICENRFASLSPDARSGEEELLRTFPEAPPAAVAAVLPAVNIRKRPSHAKRSVTIIGDSVIRDIRARRMREVLGQKVNVYVKPQHGATIEDLHDHARPAIRRDPSLIIVHGGANSLREQKSPQQLAREVIDLAETCRTERCDVAVSSICIRSDNLNTKGMEVNTYLKELCILKNIWYIDNSNITREDLFDEVHLSNDGTIKLADNFLATINL